MVLQDRSQPTFFKGHAMAVLGFVGHKVSVIITQLRLAKTAVRGTEVNERAVLERSFIPGSRLWARLGLRALVCPSVL